MLISAQELAGNKAAVIVDCRFNLLDSSAGRKAWEAGHIPGAYYADLDKDLAEPVGATTGRHPLPDRHAFAALLGSWDVTPEKLVVAYDDVSGAVAARLWWLLRWAGHGSVALLDGGLQAWEEADCALTTVQPELHEGLYPIAEAQMDDISTTDVEHGLKSASLTLIDARDAARFAGEVEPIDKLAGHIPGALNRPLTDNLDARGRFKTAQQLYDEFSLLLHGQPREVACSCGSGVTACHNLFAMELAGLPQAALFVGSWSGWISDPGRPVATGNDG